MMKIYGFPFNPYHKGGVLQQKSQFGEDWLDTTEINLFPTRRH
jgi:hypothetical protein